MSYAKEAVNKYKGTKLPKQHHQGRLDEKLKGQMIDKVLKSKSKKG